MKREGYELDNGLGAFLRQARERKGLSRQTVAQESRELGHAISDYRLSRIERGEHIPEMPTLGILARIYEIGLQDILKTLDLDLHQVIAETVTPVQSEFERLRVAGRECEMEGRLARARKYYQQALKVLEDEHELDPVDIDELRSAMLVSLANVVKRMGRVHKAEELVLEAMSNMRLSDFTHCRALIVLMGVFRERRSFTLALDIGQMAFEVARRLDDLHLMAAIEHNLANIYFSLGFFDKAAEVYESVSGVFEQLGQFETAAFSMEVWGSCLVELGRPEEGLEVLRRSLALAREHELPRAEAAVLKSMGIGYFKMGRFGNARELFTESYQLAQKVDFIDTVFLDKYYLYRMAQQTGEDPQEAERLYQELVSLSRKTDGSYPEIDEFRGELRRRR